MTLALSTDLRIPEWAAEADKYNMREWLNEAARWDKNLYVGKMNERDRRALYVEAQRGVRACGKFWKVIPVELREQVRIEAGLSADAIPFSLWPEGDDRG